MAASSAAPHFLKLPAELRNYIYELAFTTNDTQLVQLTEASPPSKALPLASRQIYHESRLIYRDAYQKFWTGAEFTVNIPQLNKLLAIKDHITQLNEEAVQHIHNLEITVEYGPELHFPLSRSRLTLVDSRGVWRNEAFESERSSWQHYSTIVRTLAGDGYILLESSDTVEEAQEIISKVFPPASTKVQIIEVFERLEWLVEDYR